MSRHGSDDLPRVPTIPNNLPVRPSSRFVGRESDMARLLFLLEHRQKECIVLRGPSEIGKTTFALQLGQRILAEGANASFGALVWVQRGEGALSMRDVRQATEHVLRGEKFFYPEVRFDVLLTAAPPTIFLFDSLPASASPDVWAFIRSLERPHCALVILSSGGGDHHALGWAHDFALEPLKTYDVARLIRAYVGSDVGPDVRPDAGPESALDDHAALRLAPLARGHPLWARWIGGYVITCGVADALAQAEKLRHRTDGPRRLFNRHVDLMRAGDGLRFQLLLALTFFNPDLGATVEALVAVLDLKQAPDGEARVAAALADLHARRLIDICAPPAPRRPGMRAPGVATPLRAAPVRAAPRPTRLTPSTRYTLERAARASLRGLLLKEQTWEERARRRWVKYYIAFSREHGGLDWFGWASEYDRIEEEWPNFHQVFAYCDEYRALDPLRDLWEWKGLLGFASIYGHWHDRLHWLGWIIEHTGGTSGAGDERTKSEALVGHALIDILSGNPARLAQAEHDLKAAQREAGATSWAKWEVPITLVHLELRRKNPVAAEHHLRVFLDLARKNDHPLGQGPRRRWRVDELQCRGLIALEYASQSGSDEYLDQAQTAFEEVLKEGEKAPVYARATTFAHNFLADIAIERAKRAALIGATSAVDTHLAHADDHLRAMDALPEHARDLRRQAFAMRSRAYLCAQLGLTPQMRKFARQALALFTTLEMEPEQAELSRLLDMVPASDRD